MNKKLVISRATWARGYRNGNINYLLDQQGMKCCLGFAAEQLCGAKMQDILNETYPLDLQNIFLDKMPWLFKTVFSNSSNENLEYEGSDDFLNLIAANDDTSRKIYNEAAREVMIAEAFAKHGIDVEFVD